MLIVEPKIRGFICTTAHPLGCARQVSEQIDYVEKQSIQLHNPPKRVLVIGSSTGYGLASRINAAFAAKASTLGVCFEREPTQTRTGSAGWYQSAAFEVNAQHKGLYAKTINGDAFSPAIKQKVIDIIKQDWQGQVDLVIYSLASPRRQVGEMVYQSVLKPIGAAYTEKTIDIMSGKVSEVELHPATDAEIMHTEKVMGGEDWELWIDALSAAGVLAVGAKTVAYSYIGPELTYPIYHQGTIGKAKAHLEATAKLLNYKMAKACQGQALVSVNKGLVTQASSAIPIVPLYISLLYKVMKANNSHEGCIEQMTRLFAILYPSNGDIAVDDQGRVRLDDKELAHEVQAQIMQLWPQLNTDNIDALTDLAGYKESFYKLFGFGVAGINYNAPVNIMQFIPSLAPEVVE